MDVLLAPCVTSDPTSRTGAVAESLARAWVEAAPHDSVDLCELSDGGPGFSALVGRRAETAGTARAVRGDAARTADGHAGRQPADDTATTWVAPGVVKVGGTAYVDVAVGLTTGTGSVGVGEQLLAALSAGSTRVVLGLPGPGVPVVVPDAGCGLLSALGVDGLRGLSLLDTGGLTGPRAPAGPAGLAELTGLGAAFALLRTIDLVGAHADDLPLLGLHGASAAAGESGALSAVDAQRLERAVGELAHAVWSAATASRRPDLLAAAPSATTSTQTHPGRVRDVTGLPGAGAGGGIGWLVALAGGRLLPGAAVAAEAVGLRPRVAAADLVVTTVDHLDASTFHGSGAEQAAAAAAEVGVPCVVVAGTSMMSRRESSAAGLSAVYVASEVARPQRRGFASALDHVPLDDVVRRVARSWSPARVAGR